VLYSLVSILAHGYLLVILLWSPCADSLFANKLDERRNMISDYLRGRAFIESVRGSVDFEHLCWF
jgi:hypothetical protein